MFVARPPAPRPRALKPPELLGSVLSEFERECHARGVRLVSELDDPTRNAWGDPDGLRHLAEILLRNALQATPPGGRILVRSSHKDDELIWSFSDNGKGIGTVEGEHLFDPFYCGRQAGRGLGLGLPLRRQDRGAGRREAAVDLRTGSRDHVPGAPAPHADCRSSGPARRGGPARRTRRASRC